MANAVGWARPPLETEKNINNDRAVKKQEMIRWAAIFGGTSAY
jgi:hypothetical protein